MLRALLCDRAGSNAVEFALVMPFLVTMLLGIFEFGRAMWTQGMLDYAVEQAARCASINATACGTASAIKTFASQQTTPLDLPSTTFSTSTTTCGNLVTASYAFQFVATGLFPWSLTLTSRSCYPT